MKHFTYEKVKLVLGKTAHMNEVVAGRCSTVVHGETFQ